MRNKVTPTLLFLILALTVFAGEKRQATEFKRFYGVVSFTPGVSYRYLKSNFANESNGGFTNEGLIEERNKYEHPFFAYAAGIKAGVRFTNYMALETGIEYSSISYQTRRNDLVTGSMFDPSLGFVGPYGSLKHTDGYHYINVPLCLTFSIGKKKLKGVISAGANMNVLVGLWQRTKWNLPGDGNGKNYESRSDIYKFSRFNLSPFICAGLDWQITNLLTLRAMPTASMQALKNIDTPLTEHLFSGGVNISLLIELKK